MLVAWSLVLATIVLFVIEPNPVTFLCLGITSASALTVTSIETRR